MRKSVLFSVLLLAPSLFAQNANNDGLTFASLQHEFAGTTLNYRQAVVEGKSDEGKALVIYLHGGSSCGTDNITQMQEPGIDSIGHYLVDHQQSAVFLVPQCPDRNRGWGGIVKDIKALLDFAAHNEGVDPDRIYIFGGSMGGTGTWKMLSSYPNYFAAAMPCAANPKGMNAENVATTPVYNVMGGADKIMDGEVRAIAEDFINQLNALGNETKYEVVAGWSHETTCIQSYTTPRLDWVFAHARQTTDFVSSVTTQSSSTDRWYSLQGIEVLFPKQPGIYVHNGRKVVVR